MKRLRRYGCAQPGARAHSVPRACCADRVQHVTERAGRVALCTTQARERPPLGCARRAIEKRRQAIVLNAHRDGGAGKQECNEDQRQTPIAGARARLRRLAHAAADGAVDARAHSSVGARGADRVAELLSDVLVAGVKRQEQRDRLQLRAQRGERHGGVVSRWWSGEEEHPRAALAAEGLAWRRQREAQHARGVWRAARHHVAMAELAHLHGGRAQARARARV